MEGNNTKGQTIFLSIIGIVTLLVAIIGATFAWFSLTVTGNDDAQSIIVTTATLGKIEFTDGAEINMENIRPQVGEPTDDNKKIFSISQTNENATESINYTISLEVTENTLTKVAKDKFVHSLTGKVYDAKNEEVEKTDEDATNRVAKLEKQTVPTSNTDLGSGTINGYETHKYEYTIIFEESGEDQNEAQGKSFSGKLKVTEKKA